MKLFSLSEDSVRRKIYFLANFGMIIVFGLMAVIFRENYLVVIGGVGIVVIHSTEIIPYKKIGIKIKKAMRH